MSFRAVGGGCHALRNKYQFTFLHLIPVLYKVRSMVLFLKLTLVEEMFSNLDLFIGRTPPMIGGQQRASGLMIHLGFSFPTVLSSKP